jgi:hypothetical protein
LALGSITARRAHASVASFHLSTILLITFSVYGYHDIWPLLTFTLSPADGREGSLLWAKVSLLAVAGIVIPLAIPRQYVPLDPKARLTSFLFISNAITPLQDPQTAINCVLHLSYDMPPPLAGWLYKTLCAKKLHSGYILLFGVTTIHPLL